MRIVCWQEMSQPQGTAYTRHKVSAAGYNREMSQAQMRRSTRHKVGEAEEI